MQNINTSCESNNETVRRVKEKEKKREVIFLREKNLHNLYRSITDIYISRVTGDGWRWNWNEPDKTNEKQTNLNKLNENAGKQKENIKT